MIEWLPVSDSQRIVAEAYLADREVIAVRFPDGTEWEYQACSLAVWAEFTAPGPSRGQYISKVLDAKPNGPLTA